jgi:ribosome-binding protein aMBF1 (putative translation factor)
MLRLTVERQVRGWNKTELARRARMQPAELSKIESGRMRPYPKQLRKLGRALGIPAAQDESLIAEFQLASEQTARAESESISA